MTIYILIHKKRKKEKETPRVLPWIFSPLLLSPSGMLRRDAPVLCSLVSPLWHNHRAHVLMVYLRGKLSWGKFYLDRRGFFFVEICHTLSFLTADHHLKQQFPLANTALNNSSRSPIHYATSRSAIKLKKFRLVKRRVSRMKGGGRERERIDFHFQKDLIENSVLKFGSFAEENAILFNTVNIQSARVRKCRVMLKTSNEE